MSDLWQDRRDRARHRVAPLAARLRPRTLADIIGQRHLLDEGKLLRRMIDADSLTSIILHGPPGTGKTSLAEVIAHSTKRRFVRENAAAVGVKRIREIIDDAAGHLDQTGTRTILFLDEIHRFTKAQQDVLLGDVERGVITLIGATTENPLFSVNSALISRSTLFRLEPLSEAEIGEVLRRAIDEPRHAFGEEFGSTTLQIMPDAVRTWAIKSEGDARRALTALEIAVLSLRSEQSHGTDPKVDSSDPRHQGRLRSGELPHERGRPDPHRGSTDGHRPVRSEALADPDRPDHGGGTSPQEASASRVEAQTPRILVIDERLAEDSIQEKVAVYGDDGHYDAASAMIKSVRGSDPDAAIYWIARMLESGEDPRFIARRLAILASEDIGNADPRAIMIAQAAWDLAERIGMPEARITLSQCATYLSCAPKSNASYVAIDAALSDVRTGRVLPVPMHLRDPNSAHISSADGAGVRKRDAVSRGLGDPYQYSHDAEGGVTGQDYLGVDRRYYEPTESGAERAICERLREIRARREALRRGGNTPGSHE